MVKEDTGVHKKLASRAFKSTVWFKGQCPVQYWKFTEKTDKWLEWAELNISLAHKMCINNLHVLYIRNSTCGLSVVDLLHRLYSVLSICMRATAVS